jgi:hypothetical protein
MILSVLLIARTASHRLRLRKRCAHVEASAALRRFRRALPLQTSDSDLATVLSATPCVPIYARPPRLAT